MGGNPRENAGGKGFWDGGSKRHGRDSESAGKTTGYPGQRRMSDTGVRVDLGVPAARTAPAQETGDEAKA